MTGAEAAQRHLARLASTARPAGSPAEDIARRYCADELAGLGFTVGEEPFEYSTFPGRWATPAAGVGSIAALAVAGHLGSRGGGVAALVMLAMALLIGVPAAIAIARRGVLSLPLGRALGVNLLATRDAAEPPVWLVAHLDSKSQTVPIAARAAGIIGSGAVWILALAAAGAQAAGAPVAGWWVWIAGAGVVAGLPVVATVVGTRSPGAVDNASGVAAVLMAARAAPRGAPIGVLITTAEELGLAGARAVAATIRPAMALNCDTVDDGSPLLCLPAGGNSAAAIEAVVRGAEEAGVSVRVRPLLPGILVDAVALADAGWQCATLSAATWRTLGRVHTSRDTTAALSGEGVARAAEVLAHAVRILAR